MRTQKEKSEGEEKDYSKTPPDVVVVRLAKDVQAMLALARKSGFGDSWPKVINRALRQRLQQEFQTKRVLNIQDKMRAAGISIS